MPLVVKIGNMWFEKMLDWGCSIFINFQPHPIFLYKTSHRNSLVTSLEHAFFTAGYPLICFRFLRFPLFPFGSMIFFGLGLGGFYSFPLVLFGFQGRNKGKDNPRKRHTNQGKFQEAISSQNASIMPVTKTSLDNIYIY